MKKQQKREKYLSQHTDTLKATIVSIMNKQAQVLLDDDTIAPCLLPTSLVTGRNTLAIGDQVEISLAGDTRYKLVKILPRQTALYRGDRRSPGEEILIATNAQCLLAVISAEYLVHQAGYPEAAIIAAKRAGLKVGLFISRWDLIDEGTKALLQSKLEVYRKIADFVYFGSALAHYAELADEVKGTTAVIIGDRGWGKSSLVQSILEVVNGIQADKSPIASTHASRLHLGEHNTHLIDTPGFREFALNEVTEEERNTVFPEISALSTGCYFSNCTHAHEEGCKVIEGLRSKDIRRERYDAYQKLGGLTPSVPKVDYRHNACNESFTCKVCGNLITPEGAGSQHRNHCPRCLSSIHVDNEPGDRASLCKGIMDPVSVWVRKGGEWAIIHRCRLCGALSSNRIAADDNPALLMSIAVKPLAMTPFPLSKIEEVFGQAL